MALPKLKEEQNLGVIVKKHPSGVMETNKEHKTLTGEIGDTLMQRVDRSVYVVSAAEMKERAKAAGAAKPPKNPPKNPLSVTWNDSANGGVDMAPPEVLTGAGAEAGATGGNDAGAEGGEG